MHVHTIETEDGVLDVDHNTGTVSMYEKAVRGELIVIEFVALAAGGHSDPAAASASVQTSRLSRWVLTAR